MEVPRPKRGSGDKAHPYSFLAARERLTLQFNNTVTHLQQLPGTACPDGDAVINMTLHPSYLAKSYYPSGLIQELGLRSVGSRAVHLVPEKITGAQAKPGRDIRPFPALQLFLAGSRDRINAWTDGLPNWSPQEKALQDEFRRIESVEPPQEDRLKPIPDERRQAEVPLEVVLHASASQEDAYVRHGFQEYVQSFGLKLDLGRARFAGGLCFLPLRSSIELLPKIAEFSFLRVLRHMPRVVPLDPLIRGAVPGFRVTLPDQDAAAPDLRVAILDGGLPDDHPLDRWVTSNAAPGVGAPIPNFQRHGLAVTSAFLFGPLQQGMDLDQPYANVDHWQVLGADTAHDDFELYSVLSRIEDILQSKDYDFVNISLGPDMAIEDDEVNSWTSTLDLLLAEGETVATVACGNNGERDAQLLLNRIQPPSDGVNMVAVGAADRPDGLWRKAPYSAVGPGRSPGYVKPDLLAFGGTYSTPFLVLEPGVSPSGNGDMGTSFAAPLAMRSGAAIRAQFSEKLWAPTIKALMVHQADNPEKHPRSEVGWGLLSHHLGDLVLCQDGEAHVIYQRKMPLTGAVRMYLPVPSGLIGNVDIKATFCFYSDIDPEDAFSYTRGGLEIQFRPDSLKAGKPYEKDGRLIEPETPPSETFFGAGDFYSTEVERRQDAQKWETTLKASKTKRASSLREPAFDVSFIAREHGHGGGRAPQVKIALVLTITSAKTRDLYDRVLTSYRERLKPLRPRIQLPLRVTR